MIVQSFSSRRIVGQDDIRQNKLLESLAGSENYSLDKQGSHFEKSCGDLNVRSRREIDDCLVCQTIHHTHAYRHTHTPTCTHDTGTSRCSCVEDVLILRLSPLSSSLFRRCVPAPLGTVNFPKSTSRYSRRYSTSTQLCRVRVTLCGNICDRPPGPFDGR